MTESRNFAIIHMKRATHIIVNLLLIVGMTMQPVIAFSIQHGCSNNFSTEYTCKGCGCCKVASAEAMCPCCKRRHKDQDSYKECCGNCSSNQFLQDLGTITDEEGPFFGLDLLDGPSLKLCENPLDSNKDDHIGNEASEDITFSFACTCHAKSQPFDKPVPRSPIVELNDILRACCTSCKINQSANGPTVGSSLLSAHPQLSSHCSQIAYCVWRL